MKIGFNSSALGIVLACGLALVPFSRAAFAAAPWKDATGEVFSPSDAAGLPKKIVALAPSIVEILEALDPAGASARLAGSSEWDAGPAWLKSKPSVGPFHRFNVEKVLALKPDLVLATTDGNPAEQVRQLRDLGLKVLVLRSGSLAEWRESIEWVGRAIGAESAAQTALASVEKTLALIRQDAARLKSVRGASGSPPTLLVALGSDPWIVPGERTLLFDALTVAGFDLRVVEKKSRLASGSNYPKYSREAIFSRRWNFVGACGEIPSSDRAVFERAGARFIQVPASFLRPSPRFVAELRDLQLAALKGSATDGK